MSGVVRPFKLVASAVLTAAIALVALPGLAGSRTPSPALSLEAAAYQAALVNASVAEQPVVFGPLDASRRSDNAVSAGATFIEPGAAPVATPTGRVGAHQPTPKSAVAYKPPRQVIRGIATFYDAGYTAMRLPRGTIIRVCGAGGCLERVVTDYGPQKPSRVIDLYRPDFFKICGCASWAGTTQVTVYVY